MTTSNSRSICSASEALYNPNDWEPASERSAPVRRPGRRTAYNNCGELEAHTDPDAVGARQLVVATTAGRADGSRTRLAEVGTQLVVDSDDRGLRERVEDRTTRASRRRDPRRGSALGAWGIARRPYGRVAGDESLVVEEAQHFRVGGEGHARQMPRVSDGQSGCRC